MFFIPNKLLHKFPILKEKSILADTIAGLLLIVTVGIISFIWYTVLYLLNISSDDITIPSFLTFINSAWHTLLTFLKLRLSIPLWGIIVFLGGIRLFMHLLSFWNARKVVRRDPILDTDIGGVTFESLYNRLSKERLRVQTPRMEREGFPAPDTVILVQFIALYEEFKVGLLGGDLIITRAYGQVSLNDSGYVVDVLAPKLVELGLLTETQTTETLDSKSGKTYILKKYKISELGYRFYDLVIEWRQKQPQAIYMQ